MRDILAYLKLADDPGADRALVRVLQRPPVLLAQSDIAGIAARSRKAGSGPGAKMPLLKTVKDMLARNELEKLVRERTASAIACIEELHTQRLMEPLPVLVEKAFHESGYYDVLLSESSHESPRSVSNISKIIDLAHDFQSRSPLNGLHEFIIYLERLLELDQLREAEADPQEESDAVQLLTVHAAKGLEFHTVFMADVRDKKFRKDAAFLLDLPPACDGEVACRVVPKRLPGSKDEAKQYNELLEQRNTSERHDQEERRIFYVALTRAQENLYITTTAKHAAFFDELAGRFAGSELVDVEDRTGNLKT